MGKREVVPLAKDTEGLSMDTLFALEENQTSDKVGSLEGLFNSLSTWTWLLCLGSRDWEIEKISAEFLSRRGACLSPDQDRYVIDYVYGLLLIMSS